MLDFLITVHVLFAILWIGGGVTLHILMRRAMRLKDGAARHAAFTELEWVGERFYPVFSLILFVAGILLVTRDDGGWEFDDTFVQIGLTGWVISSDIRATLADESTPPERKTPKGTSAIIRFLIEARSNSRILS